MARGEDEVFDDIPLDAASGSVTSLSDSDEDLGALLLRLIGGSMVALQLLNEAPADVHAAVRARITTLKSIIGNLPDKPVATARAAGKRRTPIGFQGDAG